MLVFYPLCVLMTVCISLCVSYCARTSVLCKWSYGPYCPVVFLLNFIHSFIHLFIKQACPKGIYRPSERRVETYTGRVGAERINQNYINIRKKTRRTDERTVTGALIFAHCYLLRTRPSQLLAPCMDMHRSRSGSESGSASRHGLGPYLGSRPELRPGFVALSRQ